nr:PilZ domain-containing protein [Dissulfurirhabdus thermomarina]
MKADVKEVTARSVRIHLPHTLTVFERREFFRVEVPAGSSVVIQYVSGGTAARLSGDLADLSGQGYVLDGEVVDVSLGGVAFETTPLPDIPLPSVGTRIHPVTLHLAAGPGGAPDLIRISEATVVKLRKRGDQPRARIALRFSATEEETEALAAYIRRRELAILKAAQEA